MPANAGRTMRLQVLLGKQSQGLLNPSELTELANLERKFRGGARGNGGMPMARGMQQLSRGERRTLNQMRNNSLAGFPPLVANPANGGQFSGRYRGGYLTNRRPYSSVVAENPMEIVGNRREQAIESSGFASPKNMLGTTQDGRDWAMACLHPCGAEAPMSVGLPDTITAAVTTPGYRGEYEIAFDPTMWLSGAPDPGAVRSWSAQIISLPIPEIALMYRIRSDQDPDNWSATRVLRTAGFELPGKNAKGAFDVNYTSGTTFQSIGYAKARIVGKGLTYELNSSDLNNQGRVISGQIEVNAEDEDISTLLPSGDAHTTLNGGAVAKIHTIALPDTPEYLVAACPRVYQEEAKKGAYVIHKFDSPLTGYQFQKTGSAGSIRHAAEAGTHSATFNAETGMEIIYTDSNVIDFSLDGTKFTTDSNSVSAFGPSANDDYINEGIHPWVSDLNGVMTSVTFFLGMPAGNTQTPSVGGAPTIRVKTRLFMECLANAGAGIAPFAHPSPIRDMVAIDRVVAVMQLYDDAYPACYNGFGDIMGEIWSCLKQVGSGILGGAPVIGKAIKGDWAGAIGDAGGLLLSGTLL